MQEKKQEKKQGKQENQTTIIIAGIVILLAIVFGVLAVSKNKSDTQNNTPQAAQPTSGRITQKGVITKSSSSSQNWILTGATASKNTLVVNTETFCKKSGRPILCSQLQNGHRVEVSGNLENNVITAKEINLLDEITVEAAPAQSPETPQSPQTQEAPVDQNIKTTNEQSK